MIVKTAEQIERMREPCLIVRDLLKMIESEIRPGITTKKLDLLIFDFIKKHGAVPSFLGYNGYPASACISVEDEVVHGIPSDRVLQEGEIVSIDVGAYKNSFHSDAARTFPVGRISPLKEKLIKVTEECFFKGFETLKDGVRLGDLGNAIQSHAENNGFSVVRSLVGHGVGLNLHEDPNIPNYGKPGRGLRLRAGMTVAIEPMINAGVYEVNVLDDGWTIVTADSKPSAHYENTVLITEDGAEILTL